MTWVNGIGFEKDVIEIPDQPGKYVKNDDVLVNTFKFIFQLNLINIFFYNLNLSFCKIALGMSLCHFTLPICRVK